MSNATNVTKPVNGTPATVAAKPRTLRDLLEASKARIAAVIPKHLNPDRLIKVALVAVSKDKSGKLAQCTPESVLGAVMQAAELGLEIGGSLGDAYLVPYKRSWKDDRGNWQSSFEAQCIVGYRGMINLARRSGEISSVSAHVVHENDKFRIVYGLEERLEHEPVWSEDPGRVVAAYAVCRFKDGSTQVEVMTLRQLLEVRDRPRPGQRAPRPGEAREVEGPWATDFEEMCRKTVVRRLSKYLPLSPEYRQQLEREDEIEPLGNVIDVTTSAVSSEADEGQAAPAIAESPTKRLASKLRAQKADAGGEPVAVETTSDGASYDAATGEVLDEPRMREPGEEG